MMQSMFSGASVFNQNTSSWNIVNVTNLTSMFQSSGLTRENYDLLLLGWSTQNVKTGRSFHAGSAKYSSSAAVIAARSLLTKTTASGGKGCASEPYLGRSNEQRRSLDNRLRHSIQQQWKHLDSFHRWREYQYNYGSHWPCQWNRIYFQSSCSECSRDGKL
ncbi:MAG: BspA family leucine-rich repeat surface protein [Proteobacteria bacterium]|nr:BspA family leucine-rich repeat surface protein [Pseudomonadota bacterium]